MVASSFIMTRLKKRVKIKKSNACHAFLVLPFILNIRSTLYLSQKKKKDPHYMLCFSKS